MCDHFVSLCIADLMPRSSGINISSKEVSDLFSVGLKANFFYPFLKT